MSEIFDQIASVARIERKARRKMLRNEFSARTAKVMAKCVRALQVALDPREDVGAAQKQARLAVYAAAQLQSDIGDAIGDLHGKLLQKHAEPLNMLANMLDKCDELHVAAQV